MKKMKEGLMAQWGLAMLLAFPMATSVFAKVEPTFAITEQPTAITVVEKDSSVTLSFVAQMGNEKVSYQWYSSAEGSTNNAVALKGADESSFKTGAISEKGVRYYFCVASVGEKSVTSDVAAVAYTGLPVLYVNTPKGVEITSKEDWTKKTTLTLTDAENPKWNFKDDTTSIRGRGNSTWLEPKKPYALKLNNKTEIMGMSKHKRWVLIANYLDNSFLKNHMAFYLSNMLEMDYTVRGKFVNLVFNGVYRGLYWLGEAIKVDKKRVNIYDGDDNITDTQDKDFLIEMDSHYDEVVKFHTPIRNMPYMVKNDDYFYDEDNDNAMTSGGIARLERFQNKIATLENLLYPDYGTNNNCKVNTNNCSAPDESYADIIDVESWAKFWLINEIMDNTELNEPKSAYFTYQNKDEGKEGSHDVFKAGPVWDFDAGATTTNAPIKLDTSIYYNALFKSPKFIKAVKDVWNKYSSTIDFNTEIQTMRSKLAIAAKLDSLRWGDHKDYLENAISGFDGNVDFLKNSLNNKKGVVGKYVNNKALEYVVQDGEVLTGTYGGNDKISIADGATVTLNNVIINGVNSNDYNWAGITCLGDCEIVLAENSKNTVKGFYENYPGIYVPEGKTLTISGTGSLDASGSRAAGIGCGCENSCGSIVINGGTIVARGGYEAAGIGSGFGGTVGSIMITDNVTKVTAIKGEEALYSIGVGGSREGKITIGDVVYDNDIEESPFVYPKTTEYAAVQVLKYNGGTHAVIDGTFDGTDAVKITENINVDVVDYSREFPIGKYSTMVLPFEVNTANVSGLQAVLYYNGIGKDKDGKDAIKMKVLWAEKGVIKDADGKDKEYEHTTISANTPYLVQMDSKKFEVKGPVTIVPTAEAVTKYPKWEWEFRGTWEYKKWAEGDPELGYAYGFAASEGTGINVGDFVKVGVGAWIRPMRAYLVRSDVVPKAQGVRANGAYVMRPSVTQTELPEFMSIIVDNGDGDDDNAEHTTVIGHFNTRTGEIKMNYDRGKFDLKGRRVNGTNNARGAYYGKKATVLRPER